MREHMTNWISVSKELPEFHLRVLIHKPVFYDAINGMETRVGYRDKLDLKGNHWIYEIKSGNRVQHSEITHWMPLPEPPE